MYTIGIDLGGTNIAAGLVDGEYRILCRESVKTNVPRPLSAILDDMVVLVERLLKRSGLKKENISCVGVGVPCTANLENGHIEDANNLGFEDELFVPVLEEKLGLPVFFENDANAAAWGEYISGGYSGDSFLLVTVGTGIGGGIILGGRLWSGVNHAAGEFGHMTVSGSDELCTCRRRGCFEACASATALIRQARKAMQRDRETVLWSLCGGDPEKVEAKTVFEGAGAGDALCKSLLDTYTTFLAEGIANIINIFQPEHLCVGGGVSHAGEALMGPLGEKTARRIYSKNAKRNTRLVPAQLGNDAGIIGAALLGMQYKERGDLL